MVFKESGGVIVSSFGKGLWFCGCGKESTYYSSKACRTFDCHVRRRDCRKQRLGFCPRK